MTHKEIQDLINLVSKTNLAEVKLKNGDFELVIRSKEFGSGKMSAAMPVVQAQIAQPPVTNMPTVSNAPEPVNQTEKSKPAETAVSNNYLEIKSPMVGTFYRSSGPDKPVFVQVGDQVSKGQRICIIEAMKLFNEIESEVSGKIVKVLVDDATPVEYDQPLFLVDPAG
jgi:acetyl-CoA carboxylase biotin carboxyl carrier protein